MNNLPKTTFTTARLSIEPLERKHAKLMYEDLSNPNLYKHVSQIPPSGLLELEKKFGNLEMKFGVCENEIRMDWIIKEIKTGEITGLIQSTIGEGRKAKIGYVIAEKYWKNGFASEAVSVVLQFLFNNVKVKSVEVSVQEGNINSIKLLKKLGFSIHENSSAKQENSKELLFQCKPPLSSSHLNRVS